MPRFSREERQILKQEAFSLLAQGFSKSQVIERLSISERTFRRWTKDTDFSLEIEAVEEPNTEVPQVAISPVPSNPKNYSKNDSLKVSVTTDFAVRLLSIAHSAINVTENILVSEDSSNRDRLKAVEIVSEWTGLRQASGKGMKSVLDTALQKSDVHRRLSDDNESIDLTPAIVSNKRLREEREAERDRRELQRVQELERAATYQQIDEEMEELALYFTKSKLPFNYDSIDTSRLNPEMFLSHLDQHASIETFRVVLEDLMRLKLIPQNLYKQYEELYRGEE